MMGSAFDAEVLAAARLADRLVRNRGLTWHDLLSATANDRQLPQRPPPLRVTVAECLRRPGSLRPWERGFLESLEGFARLSEKQRDCLDLIAERVLGTAAVASAKERRPRH